MPIGSAPVCGMMCGCGARVERRCESVADIPVTVGAMTEDGWSFDERGFVRCPDCRDSVGKLQSAPVQAQAPAQGKLL